MLQRGLYYAAGAVMICAIGAASLQLAMQILSFSSPLANAAAALAAIAIGGNSLRRRMRAAAKCRSVRSTCTLSGHVPAITAGRELREGRRAARGFASGAVGASTIVRSEKEDVLADRQLVGSGRHAA
jgi:hypothetical protein